MSRQASIEREPFPEGLERWLPRRVERSLGLGFLAMLPLFLAYELSVSAHGGHDRNAAEVFATFALRPLAVWQAPLRWALLALAAVLAYVDVRRHGLALGPRLARCLLEGILGAVLLGPLLIGLFAALRQWLPEVGLQAAFPARSPSPAQVGLVLGGAAWEELVFRVGLYGALFVLLVGLLRGLRARGSMAAIAAEVLALGGSAAAFAAAHLELVLAPLGKGGEPWDAALFAWRAAAGVVLASLYRWRGAGVAAWTHGLFNVGLVLGTGFEVLA